MSPSNTRAGVLGRLVPPPEPGCVLCPTRPANNPVIIAECSCSCIGNFTYCYDCIKGWSTSNNSCPICGDILYAEEEESSSDDDDLTEEQQSVFDNTYHADDLTQATIFDSGNSADEDSSDDDCDEEELDYEDRNGDEENGLAALVKNLSTFGMLTLLMPGHRYHIPMDVRPGQTRLTFNDTGTPEQDHDFLNRYHAWRESSRPVTFDAPSRSVIGENILCEWVVKQSGLHLQEQEEYYRIHSDEALSWAILVSTAVECLRKMDGEKFDGRVSLWFGFSEVLLKALSSRTSAFEIFTDAKGGLASTFPKLETWTPPQHFFWSLINGVGSEAANVLEFVHTSSGE
ncbi:hypothetical protein CBER1_00086 [Cercospora berteroae]|uniref:RING-type domain-containing protein n=1 Tax=Cercospora berteroae TaxID=357750 RepID=A0A2S6CDN2_9PEZI|nr:hypothetical protein CBER1_00086 [Cercospora berteroae]